ncbi:MAG: hypothetical protein WB646_19530 [Steroidobacteraceae bacterium]
MRPTLGLLLFCLLCRPLNATAASVSVLVSPDEAKTHLDRPLLRAIFSMRLRQWPDGTPVHVFVLPDRDAATDRFCREQLGTYPYVMRDTWDRMVFTGTGLAPTVVASEREMRERIRSTPGAIGYVLGDDTSDNRSHLPRTLLAAVGGSGHG